MADIPEDAKKLAAEAAAAAKAKGNLAGQLPADVLRVDGFAKEEAASSRDSLVVESPAEALPSAMDTDALAKARAAKIQETMDANTARYAKQQQQSVWEEKLKTVPAKEPGGDKADLDHDLDR